MPGDPVPALGAVWRMRYEQSHSAGGHATTARGNRPPQPRADACHMRRGNQEDPPTSSAVAPVRRAAWAWAPWGGGQLWHAWGPGSHRSCTTSSHRATQPTLSLARTRGKQPSCPKLLVGPDDHAGGGGPGAGVLRYASGSTSLQRRRRTRTVRRSGSADARACLRRERSPGTWAPGINEHPRPADVPPARLDRSSRIPRTAPDLAVFAHRMMSWPEAAPRNGVSGRWPATNDRTS
jgi:hypothetical protein